MPNMSAMSQYSLPPLAVSVVAEEPLPMVTFSPSWVYSVAGALPAFTFPSSNVNDGMFSAACLETISSNLFQHVVFGYRVFTAALNKRD